MTTIESTHSTQTAHGITHRFARPFLLGDAALTGANGLAYLAGATLLSDWFGTPTTWLRGIGVFLIVVGVGVALLARRRPIPRRGVTALAELNTVWVLGSVVYALAGDLTMLGSVWTVLQAVIVGAFAAGQYWFARRG